jgi:tetratricopeptide (TPR) repeat protein
MRHAFLFLLTFLLLAGGLSRSACGQTPALPDSEQVEFLLFEGQILMEEGNYPEAISRLAEAVELDPERAEAHLQLARALLRGVLAGAIPQAGQAARLAYEEYSWVLAHDPGPYENHEASRALELLEATYLREPPNPMETERGRRAWQQAQEALAGNRVEEAERRFRAAARAEPGNPAAVGAWGLVLLDLGQNKDARRALQKAIELEPGDAELQTALGEILEGDEDDRAALQHYRFALDTGLPYPPAAQGIVRILGRREADDLDPDQLILLGRAQLVLSEEDAAATALRQSIEKGGGPEATKYLAIAAFLRGDDDEAVALLEEILPRMPEDEEALYYLGAANLRRGRTEEGRASLSRLLEISPGNANGLRLLGLSLAEDPERSEEALNLLLQADAAGVRIPDISCLLGTLYMQLGRGDEAEPLLEDCLIRVPEFPGALLGLGVLADDRGRSREAIEFLSRYLAVEEQNPEPSAIFRLGVAYLRSGQDEAGFETLRRLVRRDGSDSPDSTMSDTALLEATSFFLSSARRYEDAIFIGELLLTLDSENAIYNNNLAMTYADAETNLGRAHSLAVKANRLSPENPGHMDTLGWTLLRLQRYEEAEEVLSRSLELAGPDRDDLGEVYYHMGVLYAETGRNEEAEAALQRALENPPTPFLRQDAEDLLDQVRASSRN